VGSFIESLSLATGALFVAIISGAAALLMARIPHRAARWIVALAFPVVMSYCLYWFPVWRGANSAEYSTWALLVVGAWSLAGVASSSAVVVAIRILENCTSR
jgi:hypothetical protein